MKKPTQDQWDTAADVIAAFLEFMKENEPQAENSIAALEEVSMMILGDVDEAFGAD